MCDTVSRVLPETPESAMTSHARMVMSTGLVRPCSKRMGTCEAVAIASRPDGRPWATRSACWVSSKSSADVADAPHAASTARITAPAAAAEEPRPRPSGKSDTVDTSTPRSAHPANCRAASTAHTTEAKRAGACANGPDHPSADNVDSPAAHARACATMRSDVNGNATAGWP